MATKQHIYLGMLAEELEELIESHPSQGLATLARALKQIREGRDANEALGLRSSKGRGWDKNQKTHRLRLAVQSVTLHLFHSNAPKWNGRPAVSWALKVVAPKFGLTVPSLKAAYYKEEFRSVRELRGGVLDMYPD